MLQLEVRLNDTKLVAFLGPQNVTHKGNRSLAFVSSCPQTNPVHELLTGTAWRGRQMETAEGRE